MPTKNDVATAKLARFQKFSEYVENNSNEIFVDYNDSLSSEQVTQILEGKAEDVRFDIEDNAANCMDRDDYYWTKMREDLGVERWEIEEWLSSEEGFWPSTVLDDYEWKKLLSNTSVEITATVWDAEWNFYNWAYGGPVNYSDVKESLRILGINPLDFKKAFDDSSVSLGGSHRLRGYFPDMPNRKPAVDVNELHGNMIVLYDGVLNFCLGDLAQVAEVASGETKNITFKAGTNVVMYDFGSGAGITEVQLKEDVTIPRKKVEFKNNNESRYRIQSCYGFVHSYWKEGSVQNAS